MIVSFNDESKTIPASKLKPGDLFTPSTYKGEVYMAINTEDYEIKHKSPTTDDGSFSVCCVRLTDGGMTRFMGEANVFMLTQINPVAITR